MTSYLIRSRVAKVEEKDGRWYVLFEHSREWICLGEEKPDLVVGQEVTIRIEGRWMQ